MDRVIVVGAGVVGLTCAVRLLEAGHRVDVLARDLPRETTSAVAAAAWWPADALGPEEAAWARRTREVYEEQARDEVAGVALRPLVEVAPGRERRGSTVVVETPPYLDWLVARLGDLGGTLTRASLRALPPGADVVVDAGGLGARLLAGDRDVVPVRAEAVRLEQWGLEEVWWDPAGPTWLVPRSRDVVVGGPTARGEWSRSPSAGTAEALLSRAARLVPGVAGARVLAHRVGTSPGRSRPRVEREGRVVHCYGHGGLGVSLAWGCAEEVAASLAGAQAPGPAS